MATGFESPLSPPLTVLAPIRQLAPLVFDSPHSGRNYPAEFLSSVRLSRHAIRKSEDFRVDELFAGVVPLGCPLLLANFPRAFVDVNREPFELDPKMFADDLPEFCNTRSVRVAGGLGTIARIVSETEEIYARKLGFEEVRQRIERLYRPYHAELHRLLTATHMYFGHAILVDCHSMPSSRDANGRRSRPDIVIGDRFGTSCSSEITLAAREILTGMGFDVDVNKPYAGGFITEFYGKPDHGVHTIQIEINRALYMNESSLHRLPHFEHVANAMTDFAAALIEVVAALEVPAYRLAAE